MMISQDEDFNAFRILVSQALTPNVPLDLNLRAIMAPALHKATLYWGAQTAIHLFVNPDVHEAHALVVGPDCQIALRNEEYRRNRRETNSPGSDLPEYLRLDWEEDDSREEVYGALADVEEERLHGNLSGAASLLLLLRDLYKDRRDAFIRRPDVNDSLLIFPLQSGDYPRLGYFLLWSSGESRELEQSHAVSRHQKSRAKFRFSIEQIIVRLFANFYGMQSDTYLPSFCRAESKNVTLLCARIRGLDRLSDCIDRRRDMTIPEKSACIPRLISSFNHVVARLIRKHRGRIDNLWGHGVLAVFGEYLDTADSTARPGCKNALHAAGLAVLAFREAADTWLGNDFRIDSYKRRYPEAVTVSIAIALHHGEVRFDYVGDEEHSVYVATGEQVSLVKHLAQLDETKPITLSQSAEHWVRDSIRDSPDTRIGEIRKPRFVQLPPRPETYPIYLLDPENIDLVK